MKLAYCGVRCDLCAAYVATVNRDHQMKEKLAVEWGSTNYPLKATDINCKGCMTRSEVVFKFCKECTVRLCGISKKLNNCGECNNYPCVELEKPFSMDSGNKSRLDEINKKLSYGTFFVL